MVGYRSALRKVSRGKTVKVEMEIKKGRIVKFMLSGDFFAYPPEQLEELEKRLIGEKANAKALAGIFESFRDKIEFIGVSIDDIVHLVNELVLGTDENYRSNEYALNRRGS